MRRWILSTTGLLALVLACPCVAQAQAEEAPPETEEAPPETADGVPVPASAQATAAPVPAPITPSVKPSPQASPSADVVHDHRWVFIPYFGLNLPVAAAANSYSAGFRVGGLAGWQVTPRLSINGEFTLDLMDGDTDASMLKPHEHYLDFVLSPLLHLRSGAVVVGPKLGWFTNNRSDQNAVVVRYDGPILEAHSGRGFLFGLNAGAFIPFNKLVIGLLAAATFRHFTTVDCGPYGCGGNYGLLTILSLSLAALF